MMWSLKDIPIKQKLIRVIMLTSAVVLLLTSGALIGYEIVSYRGVMLGIISTRARVLANTSTAALQFDDAEEARSILAAMHADPDVVASAFYRNGKVLAYYPKKVQLPAVIEYESRTFHDGNLAIFQPVIHDGKHLGTLYLRTTLDPLYRRLKLYATIVVSVLLVCMLIAYTLATLLQRTISHPVLALAGTARQISQRKDYSVRARKFGEDEVGELTDAFNEMLTQIHHRDLALLESAQQLNLALKASRTGTWDWDVRSNTLAWDEYTQALFGLAPGSFRGVFDDFLERVHKEDREKVRQTAYRALTDHREFDLEFRTSWPDGSTHYMSSRGRAFYDELGQPVRMSGVCLDVTERKRSEDALRDSEERMRSVVNHVVDAIITIDNRGTVGSFNPAAERIFGYSAAEVVGRNINVLMPEPYHSEHDHYLSRYLETGERKIIGIGREVTGLRKDGSVFPMELAVSEFRLGDRHYFTGMVRDITERKRAEDEIRRLNSELEERVQRRTAELAATNRELEAFTYSVSHDLRAPLRHIDGFAQILQEEFAAKMDAPALSYLRRIRKGTQNMGQLVDDLLNFARVGRLEPNQQTVDLNVLVEEVISDLKLEAKDRAIEWQLGRLPVADCDPGLIKQVFTNLLSNAIKYTRPRETAVIQIEAQNVNGETAICVRDNGVGFDMKYVDKVFGVFQRLHRAEEFEGTGVGLATVQRIIQKHGGNIWAQAEVDKGATFCFTLNSTSRT